MGAPDGADVVVVGAGLAGLACARRLEAAGRTVRLLEQSDAVGGRIRTDQVDGFLLDRGFQVLNTGYPEVRDVVDLAALDLRYFDSAVRVALPEGIVRLTNPLRQPQALGALIASPIAGARGKLSLGAYAARAALLPAGALRRRADVSGPEAWRRAGVPAEVVRDVLTPFFSGVVLEQEITASRRFLDLMMRMFARGRSAVPAGGMQRLPEQLAADLTPGALRLGTAVRQVHPGGVLTDAGEVAAKAVVVATDPWTAHRLVPALGAPPVARGVTTYHHVAEPWRAQSAALVVDAVGGSPIANSMVMSAAAPSYSGDGRTLVSTSVPDGPAGPVPVDPDVLLAHLRRLHGVPTSRWELLWRHDVPDALPAMPAPHPMRRAQRFAHEGGVVHVAGDHRDTSSIQGALVSGRRAADAVVHCF